MASNRLQERPRLVWSERPDLASDHTRGINQCCHVSGRQSPTHRGIQRHAENDTRIAAAVRRHAINLELPQPRLKVLGSELREPDSTQDRRDVPFDCGLVRRVRPRTDPRPGHILQPSREELRYSLPFVFDDTAILGGPERVSEPRWTPKSGN